MCFIPTLGKYVPSHQLPSYLGLIYNFLPHKLLHGERNSFLGHLKSWKIMKESLHHHFKYCTLYFSSVLSPVQCYVSEKGWLEKKNKMNGVRIESVNFLFNLCPCFSVDLMLYYAQNTLHSGHDLNVKPSKCEWWAHNSFNLVIWPVRPREGTHVAWIAHGKVWQVRFE